MNNYMKKITGDVNLNNLYLREIPSILNDVSIETIDLKQNLTIRQLRPDSVFLGSW